MRKSLTKACLDKQVKVRKKYSPARLFVHLKNVNGWAVVDRDSDVFKSADSGDIEALMHTVYQWDFSAFENRTIYFKMNEEKREIVGGIFNLLTQEPETEVTVSGYAYPYHYDNADFAILLAKYKKVVETA